MDAPPRPDLFRARALPPPGADAAHQPERYPAWAAARARRRREAPAAPVTGIDGVAVLAPLDAGEDAGAVARSLESLAAAVVMAGSAGVAVAAVVACAGTPPDEVTATVGRGLAPLGAAAVRLGLAPGTHRQALLDAALAAAPLDGDPARQGVLVLWPGDDLEADALALLAGALGAAPASPLAYADEDLRAPDGTLCAPALKPDWSPDLLLGAPYLGRAVLLRRRALAAAGGVAGTGTAGGDDPADDGGWWHDLLLRLTDGGGPVPHVPEVLLHRADEVAPADLGTWVLGRTGDPGGGAATAAALRRRGRRAEVAPGRLPGTWSVRPAPGATRVSVIVPFRDGPELLRPCVDDLLGAADAASLDLELVLVDNGSTDPETATLVERLGTRPGVVVRQDPRPFNWAALNNAAVPATTGSVLLFLNNDTQGWRPGGLEVLVGHALRPDIGAVGARLLYPAGTVQHAGVVVGLGGAAGHPLAGLEGRAPGYLGMAVCTREVSAVTGACLATRRSVFDELGGFDESLGVDMNDVDYCLRAGRLGYRTLFEPAAELSHLESPSRGTSGSVPDIERFLDAWSEVLTAGDPFLNPGLTRVDCSCGLRGDDEEEWWQRWRSTLSTS